MWSTIHHSQQQLVQSMLQHFRQSSNDSRMHWHGWNWTRYGGWRSASDCIAYSMRQSSCYWRLYPYLSAIGSRSCWTARLWRNDSFSASLQEWHYFLRGQELFIFDDMVVWMHASSSPYTCTETGKKRQWGWSWPVGWHYDWRIGDCKAILD